MKSGVKGVTYIKAGVNKKWRAEIGFNGSFIILGTFGKLEDAIKSRREAEAKYAPMREPLRKDNTSGYVGVNYVAKRGKWAALYYKDKKRFPLGLFTKKEDAIKARLGWELENK